MRREDQAWQVQQAPVEVQPVTQTEVLKSGWQKHPVQIKTDRIKRFRMPWKSTGKENTPKEQVSIRMRQERVPEEAEQIDRGLQDLQWSKRPKEENQIKRDGVTENTPTKQTNQTGWWNTPLWKSHTVRWMSPIIHIGEEKGHTRPLKPLGRGSNINKLDKINFVKFKTSENRVNLNMIISAVDARAGQRRVEF